MNMQITHIIPYPQLYGYVSKIRVFESSGRIPAEDMRLIVPNGCNTDNPLIRLNLSTFTTTIQAEKNSGIVFGIFFFFLLFSGYLFY